LEKKKKKRGPHDADRKREEGTPNHRCKKGKKEKGVTWADVISSKGRRTGRGSTSFRKKEKGRALFSLPSEGKGRKGKFSHPPRKKGSRGGGKAP